jgi:hypothetical protein
MTKHDPVRSVEAVPDAFTLHQILRKFQSARAPPPGRGNVRRTTVRDGAPSSIVSAFHPRRRRQDQINVESCKSQCQKLAEV